jgi:hypothetical protein
MSLRRNRKRRAIAGIALAKILPVRKVTKAAAVAKAAKGAGKAASRRKPVRVLALAAAAGGAVAAVRRRRAQQAELDFGRPNESVPSHEALAGARQAAGAQST